MLASAVFLYQDEEGGRNVLAGRRDKEFVRETEMRGGASSQRWPPC
jgi:hypothetical protein